MHHTRPKRTTWFIPFLPEQYPDRYEVNRCYAYNTIITLRKPLAYLQRYDKAMRDLNYHILTPARTPYIRASLN